MEVGAGAGLPSVVACKHRPSRVVISDYPSPVILDNIQANVDSWSESLGFLRDNVSVVGYDWGTRPEGILDGFKFDIILLADVFWLGERHDRLLDSLDLFLADRGVVHVTCGNHATYADDNDNLTGTSRQFWQKARERGWLTEMLRIPEYANEHVFIGRMKRRIES